MSEEGRVKGRQEARGKKLGSEGSEGSQEERMSDSETYGVSKRESEGSGQTFRLEENEPFSTLLSAGATSCTACSPGTYSLSTGACAIAWLLGHGQELE